MEVTLSLNLILDRVAYSRLEGELDVRAISGIATISEARKGDLSFVASAKYLDQLAKSRASIVIIGEDLEATPRQGQLFLMVENPSLEMAKLCEIVASRMWARPAAGISNRAVVSSTASVHPSASVGPFAMIDDGAIIGPDCVVGAGCIVGAECRLEEGCWLSPRVTLERDTSLGKRVRLHSGVVLGCDGFGYELVEGKHKKVPQVGRVRIEDDVEIGANTTIDRGRFGPTTIGEGTKIDNLVQIGHNVVTGKHCILCAQVGIAGSTTLGDYVVMGGRAGASGHLEIASGAQLAGQCVAFSDLEGGRKWGGAPAVPLIAYQRMVLLQRRLPELFTRMKRLEEQLLGESRI